MKDESESECSKLKELLDEADQSLKMLEERLEPLQQENDEMMQKMQLNETVVQSLKQDFQ